MQSYLRFIKYTLIAIVLCVANSINFFDLDDTQADKIAKSKWKSAQEWQVDQEFNEP